MPFNVNQFIRKVNHQVQPKVEPPIENPVVKQEQPVVKHEERKQEIEIPVYVPDSDSDSEFTMAPVKPRMSPSFELDRKVALNPLSDS
jgi:hypothetical protein